MEDDKLVDYFIKVIEKLTTTNRGKNKIEAIKQIESKFITAVDKVVSKTKV